MTAASPPSESACARAGAGAWPLAVKGSSAVESPPEITTSWRRPGMPNTEQTVVLLCSDVSEVGPSPISAAAIAAALRRGAPQARIFIVENLCSGPAAVSATLQTLEARRVAIGCRQGATRREEILAHLRRARIHPSGVQLVDLMPAEQSVPAVVGEQSIARMRAALARLSCADLEGPVSERMAPGSVEVSRRSAFRLGNVARRPVACFTEGRCDGGGCCRACVEACPHGALHLTGVRLSVDGAACTGCGACLSVCGSGAISLNGSSISELEAAASVLVAEARQLGSCSAGGVAIVCARAVAEVPLGGSWLPLEVPSLEMVSAGWPLQVLSAGVGVKLVGCDDDACASRGRELSRFCADLVDHAAPAWRPLIGQPERSEPLYPSRSAGIPAGAPASIKLREPEATARVLSALVSLPSDYLTRTERWRIESPAASLGEITIDGGGCSACGCCTLACPTGALKAAHREGVLAFSVDASACSACGACVSSCPEAVVTLRRVVDSVSFAEGRRRIAEVGVGACCESCGRPLASGLAGGVVGLRLATSHPQIAARLRDEGRCTDCLLMARRPVRTKPTA